MPPRWWRSAWQEHCGAGWRTWLRLLLAIAVGIIAWCTGQYFALIAALAMVLLHVATFALVGIEAVDSREETRVNQVTYEAISLSMHLLVATIATLLSLLTVFGDTIGAPRLWVSLAGGVGIGLGVWGVMLLAEPDCEGGTSVMINPLRWQMARFFWWVELFSLLSLIGFVLVSSCAPEVPPTATAAPTPTPLRRLTSVQVLETSGIAVFDAQTTEYIEEYVESLPVEGPLDTAVKGKLTELLVLDAFEVSLISQPESFRWEPGCPVHVTLEHAWQAVTLAPTSTKGTGSFCDEAGSIYQGELEGQYVFFYASDYLRFAENDLTPLDISADPYSVVETFYSPLLGDEHLMQIMGIDSPAIPLQALAWKMKVDIVAGWSAEELIQWYETSGFRDKLLAWPQPPAQ